MDNSFLENGHCYISKHSDKFVVEATFPSVLFSVMYFGCVAN